ncbi:Inherit from bactNOG: 2og-fe(ii) oxygenase [Seminavis robusta]|uniref:Inherit from bactNOG: 2og-fe(Ii) oxygenase n=1 Tax=Seminavis robusta TaxID=568900 RepID=A0A9N8ESG8_9STRA|nr:Inherit from bactNOG: 2og-fe(ii) oxygenase [Seminavis robusta]|eukprot:Sro1567_g282980.1 Inherit from bactNOG: 2og-fe(ii) oxygenase (394) ;mRNA; f:12385-13566
MAPIFPVGIVLALIAVMTVRYQNVQEQQQMSATDIKSTQGNITTATIVSGALEKAREIRPPAISVTKGGEYEHGEFWGDQDPVIKAAWEEWWNQQETHLPDLLDPKYEMMDASLAQAIQQLRKRPSEENEDQLRQLFQPIVTNQVYQIPFLTPRGVQLLRQHLDAASYYYNDRKRHNNQTQEDNIDNVLIEAAGIPTRRPNGMNRYGVIIDPNIEGAVSYPGINTWMQQLVDEFVRPLLRMLFPQLTSRHHPEDDCESYAFTIRYHPEEDMELKEHSDASVYTININLNLAETTTSNRDNNQKKSTQQQSTRPSEQYKGSSLYFLDPVTGSQRHVSFAPGTAVLHRGLIRHAALPIQEGERHNLVIWLFGRHGYVRFGEYPKIERLTVADRWG